MKFCPNTRLGDSVDEMNENIITAWNNWVKKDDFVYHLGDFAWKAQKAEAHFVRLNGHKHLIVGNHDSKTVKNLPWKSVTNYREIKHNGRLIILMHYPMLTWKNADHGSIHLYGHVHGTPMDSFMHTTSMDVGMDALDPGQVLISLETVLWNFRGYEKCPDCDGHGQVSDYGMGLDFEGPKECSYCDGSGSVRKNNAN
jgi:calcineurin-like phosphoesterase family protein